MVDDPLLGFQTESLRFDALLGRGTMGAVYRGTQLRLGRQVAIKVIASHLCNDTSYIERFSREAQTLGRLVHPHVIACHDFGPITGPAKDTLFVMVLEFVDGWTLGSMISSQPLRVRQVIDLHRQAAEGLAAAHDLGIIHRDIKPDNIMVTRQHQAKLADFGLAKAQDSALLTHSGTIMGSPAYMSPETCRGEAPDRSSDIYSLGCSLFHAMTGSVPYPASSPLQAMNLHVTAPIPSMGATRPDLAALDPLMRRCLAKEPSDRFADAQVFARELRGAMLLITADVACGAAPGAADPSQRSGPSASQGRHTAATIVTSPGATMATAIPSPVPVAGASGRVRSSRTEPAPSRGTGPAHDIASRPPSAGSDRRVVPTATRNPGVYLVPAVALVLIAAAFLGLRRWFGAPPGVQEGASSLDVRTAVTTPVVHPSNHVPAPGPGGPVKPQLTDVVKDLAAVGSLSSASAHGTTDPDPDAELALAEGIDAALNKAEATDAGGDHLGAYRQLQAIVIPPRFPSLLQRRALDLSRIGHSPSQELPTSDVVPLHGVSGGALVVNRGSPLVPALTPFGHEPILVSMPGDHASLELRIPAPATAPAAQAAKPDGVALIIHGDAAVSRSIQISLRTGSADTVVGHWTLSGTAWDLLRIPLPAIPADGATLILTADEHAPFYLASAVLGHGGTPAMTAMGITPGSLRPLVCSGVGGLDAMVRTVVAVDHHALEPRLLRMVAPARDIGAGLTPGHLQSLLRQWAHRTGPGTADQTDLGLHLEEDPRRPFAAAESLDGPGMVVIVIPTNRPPPAGIEDWAASSRRLVARGMLPVLLVLPRGPGEDAAWQDALSGLQSAYPGLPVIDLGAARDFIVRTMGPGSAPWHPDVRFDISAAGAGMAELRARLIAEAESLHLVPRWRRRPNR